MKWIEKLGEEYGITIRKRWQKILFLIALIIILFLSYKIAVWYYNSGYYWRAWGF